MPTADDDAPIFLIGFMASGKTTVGRLLAERLAWAFVDLDRLIEEGAGKTVAEIFSVEGEAGFRKRETAAVRAAAQRRKTVVATGGGAPCREENLEAMLAAGRVYWLEVSVQQAVERAGQASGRPLLDAAADPLAEARRLLAVRERFYARAHLKVDTDGRSAGEVATVLLMKGPLKAELMAMVRDEMLKS
jgi:shikimate kinase